MINQNITIGGAFTPSVKITFPDSTVVNVPASGIGLSNTRLTDSAESDTLPVGSAIGRTLQLELVNDEGQWNNYDFFGAVIDLKLTYGTNNVVEFKSFTCDKPPESLGTYIQIECLDNMWKADKAYNSTLSYPTTVGSVWSEVCSKAGLTRATTSHAIFSISVPENIFIGYTCRQMLGFIAALAGGNAKITAAGSVAIVPWNIPDENTSSGVQILDNWIKLNPALTDVTITGVAVAIPDADGVQTLYVEGQTDYVLQLEDNPLFTTTNVGVLLPDILDVIGNKPIRPYTGETYFFPIAETGDGCIITDRDGNDLYSVITSASWTLGGRVELKCGIDVPINAGRSFTNPAQQALAEARQMVGAERVARTQAITDLWAVLGGASSSSIAVGPSGGAYKQVIDYNGGRVMWFDHNLLDANSSYETVNRRLHVDRDIQLGKYTLKRTGVSKVGLYHERVWMEPLTVADPEITLAHQRPRIPVDQVLISRGHYDSGTDTWDTTDTDWIRIRPYLEHDASKNENLTLECTVQTRDMGQVTWDCAVDNDSHFSTPTVTPATLSIYNGGNSGVVYDYFYVNVGDKREINIRLDLTDGTSVLDSCIISLSTFPPLVEFHLSSDFSGKEILTVNKADGTNLLTLTGASLVLDNSYTSNLQLPHIPTAAQAMYDAIYPVGFSMPAADQTAANALASAMNQAARKLITYADNTTRGSVSIAWTAQSSGGVYTVERTA